VGLVSGARWLPYMLFELVAGAMIDRLRRRPVMIVADLMRAALLVIVPALALTHPSVDLGTGRLHGSVRAGVAAR
jgi:hypothetical protein